MGRYRFFQIDTTTSTILTFFLHYIISHKHQSISYLTTNVGRLRAVLKAPILLTSIDIFPSQLGIVGIFGIGIGPFLMLRSFMQLVFREKRSHLPSSEVDSYKSSIVNHCHSTTLSQLSETFSDFTNFNVPFTSGLCYQPPRLQVCAVLIKLHGNC